MNENDSNVLECHIYTVTRLAHTQTCTFVVCQFQLSDSSECDVSSAADSRTSRRSCLHTHSINLIGLIADKIHTFSFGYFIVKVGIARDIEKRATMTIQRFLSNKHPVVSVNRLLGVRVFSSDTFKNDDYQYLQKGQIPMLYFQRSLPRLKIPALNETCDRFLAATKPILSKPAEFEELAKMVGAFQTTGSGPQLQKFLQNYDAANKHTSYVSKPWFDMYLSDRKPLPVNYNPALIMKLDSRPEYNNQLTRTINLVVSSLRFMRSLREELLEPEVFHLNPQKSDTDRYRWVMNRSPSMIATFVSYAFKAFPLDMSQVCDVTLMT